MAPSSSGRPKTTRTEWSPRSAVRPHGGALPGSFEEEARLLRRLLDQSTQPFAMTDFDGRILRVNAAFERLTGYAADQLRTMTFPQITPKRWDQAEADALEQLRSTGASVRYQKEYRRQDGQVVPVELVVDLLRDQHDVPRGYYAFITDISQRVEVERALRASERKARALFEGIEDAVIVHSLEGRILDVNPAACRILGYTDEELLRMTTRDIDHPDFAVGFSERLREQMQHGRLSCEGHHRTKEGRIIPVDINTSLIQYDEQPAVLAVIRDITDRKALEETRRQFAEAQMRNAQELERKNRALSESEARYRQLTEGCLDAVVVADQEGRITLFNPAAERTFGYQAPQVLGQPLAILMPHDMQPPPHQAFGPYLQTRRPRLVGRTVELRGRRQSGEEFPLELSLSAVEIAGQLQFIGSIRDQTERQQMRDALVRTERLASIGLLSAGVAHEINNPLAYVANNLAVLERDIKGVRELVSRYEGAWDRLRDAAPEVAASVQQLSDEIDWPYIRDNLDRMLARTRDGVQRVANIVQNLRGLARTSPTRKEEAWLPDLLANAQEMVQGRLRRHHIELRIEEGAWPKIPCVAPQISQVFLNLIVNAIQAIEASRRPEHGVIRVVPHTRDAFVLVEVSDNGCGIDPEDLTHIFDPFFTTKPVGEGTGLGLSISHNIITGHGGHIEVESRPGEGTTFRVFLPLKPS